MGKGKTDRDPSPGRLRRWAALQERLAERVVCEDRLGRVRWIAGVDVDFRGDRGRAAAVSAARIW